MSHIPADCAANGGPTISRVTGCINDEQREAVRAAVAEALGGAYDCTRVWEAWQVGTMGPDDFVFVSTDDYRVAEIADAAIEAMRPATPPAQGPAPDSPAEALAARRLLQEVARLDNSAGITVAEVRQLAAHAAAWLRENPPGQPVAIEPRGCPTPGACSCVVPAALPAPEVGEVGELVARLRNRDRWTQLTDAQVDRAATLLQQVSAPAPAVAPVAVSERLPGPEDCDEDGFCWMGYGYKLPGVDEKDSYAMWMLMPSEESSGKVWAPASAIPLPQVGEVEA
jgi:hypothetical protein